MEAKRRLALHQHHVGRAPLDLPLPEPRLLALYPYPVSFDIAFQGKSDGTGRRSFHNRGIVVTESFEDPSGGGVNHLILDHAKHDTRLDDENRSQVRI